MIIKLDPHAFVVFLTLAMGMSYAVFHSFSRWGIWKIVVIAIVVVPFVFIGVSQGHVIDIALGSLIGTMYTRGGFYFPLFEWIHLTGNERPKKGHSSQSKSKSERSETQSSFEEEVERRQRQARRGRGFFDERDFPDFGKTSKSEKSQGGYSNSSGEQSKSDTKQYIGPLNPTNIDDAFKILGLEKGVSLSECKQAYRTLISIYNSDKINRLSGHRKSQAEEEAKDINRAWATIKKYYDARK